VQVGVIGLGLLGDAIARRLRAAGFEVCGHDLDAAKVAALANTGVTPATPEAMASGCEVIVLAVFTSDEVAAVAEQLYATGVSRTLVCTTTCAPAAAAAHAARAQAAGWGFVEAPLSGTSAQVLAGAGVGLIAGEPAAIARAGAVLAAICPRRHRLGRAGDAARAKLAVNLILGINRAAFAEGLVFAERMGLDGAAFLAIARDSAAYSQVMDTKGEKMLRGDYAPEGRAEQAQKDVRLMQAEGERIGQPLPLLAVHAALLDACVARGEGAEDSSVVVEELRRRGAGQPGAPR
jgi:3-hydroxyisobutyrate dehydrogenase-like beta-hydroxyacid dehydrogenase